MEKDVDAGEDDTSHEVQSVHEVLVAPGGIVREEDHGVPDADEGQDAHQPQDVPVLLWAGFGRGRVLAVLSQRDRGTNLL